MPNWYGLGTVVYLGRRVHHFQLRLTGDYVDGLATSAPEANFVDFPSFCAPIPLYPEANDARRFPSMYCFKFWSHVMRQVAI